MTFILYKIPEKKRIPVLSIVSLWPVVCLLPIDLHIWQNQPLVSWGGYIFPTVQTLHCSKLSDWSDKVVTLCQLPWSLRTSQVVQNVCGSEWCNLYTSGFVWQSGKLWTAHNTKLCSCVLWLCIQLINGKGVTCHNSLCNVLFTFYSQLDTLSFSLCKILLNHFQTQDKRNSYNFWILGFLSFYDVTVNLLQYR